MPPYTVLLTARHRSELAQREVEQEDQDTIE